MIIGICGDSGSGKTTLSKAIQNCISDVLLHECDRYHKWERGDEKWKQFTHLNPNANNLQLMCDDIIKLKAGYKVWAKDYSHDTGKFTTEKLLIPTGKLIVSGLHTLMFPNLFDLKIYLDTDKDLKKHWKVNRDVKERGYKLNQVLDKIKKREGDFLKYIAPQKNSADLIIRFSNEGLKLDYNNSFNTDEITNKLHKKLVSYQISFDKMTSINFPSAFNYEIITLFIMDWYDRFKRN